MLLNRNQLAIDELGQETDKLWDTRRAFKDLHQSHAVLLLSQ